MARKPEAKVKDKLKIWLKKTWPDLWWFMPPSGRFSRKGVSDMLLCIRGLFVTIEVKATKDQDPSPMQNDEIRLVSKAGGIVCVLRSFDEVKLQKLKRLVNERADYLEKAIQAQKEHRRR